MNTQPTVSDLIRTEAIIESQVIRETSTQNPVAKIETADDDVQFSFEFNPQKISTQIPGQTTIQPSFCPPTLITKTETQTVIQR